MSQAQATPTTPPAELDDWEAEMNEILAGDTPAEPATPLKVGDPWPPFTPEATAATLADVQAGHATLEEVLSKPAAAEAEPTHEVQEQEKFELPPQGALPRRWHVVDEQEMLLAHFDLTEIPVGLVNARPTLWDELAAQLKQPTSHPLKGDSRLANVLFTMVGAKDWNLTPAVFRYVDLGRPEPGRQELHVISQICLWRGAPWWVIINYSEATHGIESLFLVNANLLA